MPIPDVMNLRQWVEHPLVRKASENAESVRDTAIHLHRILCELEDRFPGVPFGQILAGPAPELNVRQLVGAMRWAGVAERDINRVVGREALADRWDDDWVFWFGKLKDGAKRKDLRTLGLSKRQAELVSRARQPLTDLEQQVLEHLFDGLSQHETAKLVECSLDTIAAALMKHRYRRWLDRNLDTGDIR
jgi:DNA-binding CsgD family transcriptional regulator